MLIREGDNGIQGLELKQSSKPSTAHTERSYTEKEGYGEEFEDDIDVVDTATLEALKLEEETREAIQKQRAKRYAL